MPSSAEGPEGANPGNFPVHPMQNIALARLLCPQRSQTLDIRWTRRTALAFNLHQGPGVYVGAFLLLRRLGIKGRCEQG
jgi:hypothetical protein